MTRSEPVWERGVMAWTSEVSFERVSLRGVTLQLFIGLNADERLARQRVVVDVDLYRRREGLPEGATLGDCLDYDRLQAHLAGLPERGHVELLEALAEELVRVCLADPRVEACRVVLRKPEVYGGNGYPEIEVWRRRG